MFLSNPPRAYYSVEEFEILNNKQKEAQVLELVEYGGGGGSSFSAEADGYTSQGENLNDALETQDPVAPF